MTLAQIPWLAIGRISLAGGEPVVLYDELPDLAVQAALERGKAQEPVQAWPISALRARPPYVVGAGEAWSCSSRAGSVFGSLQQARRAIGHVQLDAAEAALDDALQAALCQPVDPDLAFEIWFLHGMVAIYRKDEASAARAFRNARMARPDRGWDDHFADGQELFERARPEPPSIRLSVIPAQDRITVDGAPAQGGLLLSAGSHLLELGEIQPVTLRVDLEGRGSATLVVPMLLPDAMLGWPAEPARWRELELVLAELPGPPSAIGLYDAPDLWWATAAHGPYERVPAPPPPVERRTVPNWAKAMGAVGLAGASSAGICMIGGMSAYREGKAAESTSDYFLAKDRYDRWHSCVVASDAVAVVGLGSGLVGLLWGWRAR